MRGSSRDVTSPRTTGTVVAGQARVSAQQNSRRGIERRTQREPRSGMIAPMGTTSTTTMPMPAAPTALQQARLDLGLTQSQVIDHLPRLARRRGIALPSHESIRSRLSAWENGRATPDSVYASLLRTLYGRTDAELGFISRDNVTPPAHSHDEAMMEIRARLACSSGVDGDLIARLDRHRSSPGTWCTKSSCDSSSS